MELPRRLRSAAVLLLLLALSMSLIGCTEDIPHIDGYLRVDADAGFYHTASNGHTLAYWMQEPEYFSTYASRDGNGTRRVLNSCMDPTLMFYEVCNGVGHCAAFDDTTDDPLLFCKCNLPWSGLDCKTKRKSKFLTFIISLCFGPLALDQLYLGWPMASLFKFTVCAASGFAYAAKTDELAGLLFMGVWVYDIVRIGGGTVHSRLEGHLAEDLPRWTFVAFTLLYFNFLGLGLGIRYIRGAILVKRYRADQALYYGAAKLRG